MKYFFLLSFVVLFVLIPYSEAFKVSAYERFPFEPNTVKEGKVCVFTDNDGPLHVKISPTSELAKIIEIDEEGELFLEKSTCIPYTLNFPSKYTSENPDDLHLQPGFNGLKLSVMEIKESGGQFGTVRVLNHMVKIYVPYPGKYLDAGFSAKSANQGDPINFSIKIEHKGDQTIDRVTGVITVFNGSGARIDTVSMKPIVNVMPQETKTQQVQWDSEKYASGRYSANLSLDYGGEDVSLHTNFIIGGLDFDMGSYSKHITKGGLREFYVEFENLWGETIPDVQAMVSINENDTEQVLFQLIPHDFKAFEKHKMIGYVQTDRLSPGNHSGGITLSFSNFSKSFDITLELKEDVQPVQDEPISMTIILMGVIVALVLFLLAGILFYILKNHKKK